MACRPGYEDYSCKGKLRLVTWRQNAHWSAILCLRAYVLAFVGYLCNSLSDVHVEDSVMNRWHANTSPGFLFWGDVTVWGDCKSEVTPEVSLKWPASRLSPFAIDAFDISKV